MLRNLHARRRRVPVAVAVSLLVAAALPAAAGPSDRLQRLEERKAAISAREQRLDAEGDALAHRVAALDARRAQVEAAVDDLDAELARLDARLTDVRARLTRAQREMAVLTADLQDVLARLDARIEVFTERAVAAYMAGPTAYVDGLLSSDSFSDLVDRFEYYQSALSTDSALVTEISALRDDVEQRRDAVAERQELISEAKLALEDDRSAVQLIRAQKAAQLAARQAIVDEKESILAGLRQRQQRLQKIYAEFDRRSAQIEFLLAGGSSGPFPVGGGQLLWPAAGPVVSGYGYRTHPIFGDQRLHTGIDIAAGYGAPVVAADSGVVVFAGVLGGYGNAIVIDHGGGLGTTYNHLSAFLVAEGQQVARGSHIGAVGCTGYCTGPHLHFEVRINGTPVDPMPYLQ